MSLERRVVGLLEDDPIMGESLVQRLALEGTVVRWWTTGREALAEIERARPEAVICDIRLPDMSGEDVFRAVADRDAAPPFLFITGYGDIDQAVRLIRVGRRRLSDQAIRDAGLPRSAFRIAAAAARPRRREVLGRFRSHAFRRADAVGASRACARPSCSPARPASARRSRPAFFTQASGRERAVHGRQLRGDPRRSSGSGALRPRTRRVHRRAGAPPRLGGARRRRHAVSRRDRRPRAAHCRRSCCVLSRTASSIASAARPPVAFRARVVCATNADLEKRVREGRFREDLFYRINVVSIAVPPLRERQDDIAWLLDQFFDQFNAEGELAGVSGLAEEAALASCLAWQRPRTAQSRGACRRAGARALAHARRPLSRDSGAQLASGRAAVARGCAPRGGAAAHPPRARSDRRRDHSGREGARHFPHDAVGEDAPPRHRHESTRRSAVRKSEQRRSRRMFGNPGQST